jgi:CspA family cold shock protein
MTSHGTVKAWVDAKGFGFITAFDGEDVFVHRVNLVGCDALNVGDQVTFDLSYDDKKNKKTAMNVVGGTGTSPKMMMENGYGPGKGAGPPSAPTYPYSGYGKGAPAMPAQGYVPAPPIPAHHQPAHAPPPGLMPPMQAPSYAAPTGQPLEDYGGELPPGKYRGTVKAWNDMKGFGFIQTPGMEDIFVHRCDLVGVEALIVGDNVQYSRDYDEKKRKEMAKEVVGGTGRVAGSSGPSGRPVGLGQMPMAPAAGAPSPYGMGVYGAYGKGNGLVRTGPY